MTTLPMIYVIPITGPDAASSKRICLICKAQSSLALTCFLNANPVEKKNWNEKTFSIALELDRIANRFPNLHVSLVVLNEAEAEQEEVDIREFVTLEDKGDLLVRQSPMAQIANEELARKFFQRVPYLVETANEEVRREIHSVSDDLNLQIPVAIVPFGGIPSSVPLDSSATTNFLLYQNRRLLISSTENDEKGLETIENLILARMER